MRKILLAISLLFLPFVVHAASGTIKVTGQTQVVQGKTYAYKVTLASSTKIGSWQMELSYDSGFFDLVSATSEAGGVGMVNVSSSGVTSKVYTFNLKAKKTGSTTVGVRNYQAYAMNDTSKLSLRVTSKKVNIITQAQLEASYSKNNNLKDIKVGDYTLNPAFNKDTLEYSVIVPEGTNTINISAIKEDSKAKVSGDGEKELTPGLNTFSIVVTSQSGASKTYTLNVDVKDEFPIIVNINDKEYTVIKLKELLPEKSNYDEDVIQIDEFDIPVYINKKVNIVLVGLKDEDGLVTLFRYSDDEYSKYDELTSSNITIIPKEKEINVKGFKKGTITFNDKQYEAYKNANYALINGINLNTGKEDLYLIDLDNLSMIKYNEELFNVTNVKSTNALYLSLIIGFIIIIVIQFVMLLKKDKKPLRFKK